MSGPAHNRKALAEFQNSEPRLVYARYKDRPHEVFHLQDNEANTQRAFTKEHLECFIPECTSRSLTTVSRGKCRDGFRHIEEGAGGHAPERLFHQQGKALIARWGAARYPDVRVDLEKDVGSGARRPDVLLTWPDGRQVAVEIQYSAEGEWLSRHRSYQALGVRDVWLLGHIPPHLRSARPGWDRPDVEGRIEISSLPERMAAKGVPLLWINPVDELIGTAWIEVSAHRCHAAHCPILEERFSISPRGTVPGSIAFFDTDRLDDCTLTPDGRTTPKLRALRDAAAEYRQALTAERERQEVERDAEKRRAEQEARRAAVQEKDRAARRAVRDRIRQCVEEQRPVFARRWEASQLRRKVLGRYRGVPDVLAVTLSDADAIFAHPEHWHAALYGDLTLGRAGSQFSVGDCFRVLRMHRIDYDRANRWISFNAVTNFLRHLADQEIVWLHHEARYPRRIASVEVLGDIETAAQHRAAREAEKGQQAEERRHARMEHQAAKQQRFDRMRENWTRRRATAAQGRQAPAVVPASATPRSASGSASTGDLSCLRSPTRPSQPPGRTPSQLRRINLTPWPGPV